jgi:hypothetical protein
MDKKAREKPTRYIDFFNDCTSMWKYMNTIFFNDCISIGFMIQVILLKLKEEGFVEDDKRRTRSIQVWQILL